MATTTNVAPLKINYLTQAQYDTALANSQINSDELYFTPAETTYTPSSHTHGNISNTGTIGQTSGWTLASGDGLVVFDTSNSNKLERTGITFDGSTATKALTQKGTWETFNNYSHPTGDGNLHVPATSTTNNGKFLKAGSTAGSLSWANVSWSDITSKPLTLTAATTGFTIAGGTTSKTLTVSESYTLGAACAKAVDTSISAGSTSTNLPTSKAVATFVEGKGYITSAGITSVKITTTSPLSGGNSTAVSSGAGTWSLSIADNYGDTKNPYASKTANYVLAAPNGSAGAPSFRALVAADIPALAAGKITSGTFDAARIPTLSITDKTSGTLTVARGGTGVTSFTNDAVIVATGTTQTLVSRGLSVTGNVGAATTLSTATDKTLTITSGSTLYLDAKASTSTIFRKGTSECARFNIYGNLALGSTDANSQGTQNTHKLYVNGASAFNGQIAFGAQAGNAITENASMNYNTTLHTIDFIVT